MSIKIKILFIFLVALVTFVNGWTDAPNAIASCISTRSMRVKKAVLLAGVFNLLGSLAPVLLSSGVAKSVYSIVDFGGNDELAMRSLCAGMCAVVIWAVLAFLFGLPTSESHALLSGITGAALGSGFGNVQVNISEWLTVLWGLLLSTLPAFFAARLFYSVILHLCGDIDRRLAMGYFARAQRFSAATSSFLHGAQDSQKFVGVLMLGLSLGGEYDVDGNFKTSVLISLACAAVMTLGTLCGGSRIIRKVGEGMVTLDAAAGTASDAASSVTIGLCTLLGIPVSTTHSKTCAMMGAGSITGKGVDRGVVRQLFFAWALTFPCCAAIGFAFGMFI